MKADISSGADPRKKTLDTFYPVFPIGNYVGVLADTRPGPVNFIDVRAALEHGENRDDQDRNGLVVGFLIGVGCRYFDIPAPSPLVLPGALLVAAMTLGYNSTDRLLS